LIAIYFFLKFRMKLPGFLTPKRVSPMSFEMTNCICEHGGGSPATTLATAIHTKRVDHKLEVLV
jgi:hypothetical protein